MGFVGKVTIAAKAFKKVNKRKLLKKVYCALKVGGIKHLKGAIILTALRNEEPDNALLGITNNIYLYQQNKPTEYVVCSECISVIIYINENQDFITDTLDSINRQLGIKKVEVILYVTDSYCSKNKYKYKTFLQRTSSMNDIINSIEGDFFMLIKAGNILAPNALYSFINELKKGNAFAYSDECIWNFEDNKIHQHILKPDFSPFYLFNSLYTEQSVCFNKNDLITSAGSQINQQDPAVIINEMVLRLIEKGKTPIHIEKILLLRHYHYEQNSVPDTALYISMIENALSMPKSNTQIKKKIVNYSSAFYAMNTKVSIILVSKNQQNAFKSIRDIMGNTSYLNYKIILTAGAEICSAIKSKTHGDEKIVFAETEESCSYTKACNLGFEKASGDIVVFIQDNIIPKEKNWLEEIVKCFSLPFVGGVSPKIINKDNIISYAGAIAGGRNLSSLIFENESNEKKNDKNEIAFISRETSILSASCLAVRNKLFKEAGKFNEMQTPDKLSNIDLSFEIGKQGYSLVFCATSTMINYEKDEKINWSNNQCEIAYMYILKKWIHNLTRDHYITDSMKMRLGHNTNHDIIIYSDENILSKQQYKKQGRNILLIIHELAITGAPVAIHYAAKALLDNGEYPVIISPTDGNLRNKIVEDGIPVIIDKTIFTDGHWIKMASNFDMVLVCTLACYSVIKYLEMAKIPTLWWAHEARESYEGGQMKVTIPEKVQDNIKVFCGGEYARKLLHTYRPSYVSDLLLYAVPDFSKEPSQTKYIIPDLDNKIVFSTIGSVMKRKGQDILAKAIMELSRKDVEKCRFIFIGKMIDAEVYLKIQELKNKYPKEVIIIDEVSRDELMEVYKVCDSVICASRDDPMPIFMTEAMMFSKICICSENTGTASLLQDGANGFVYRGDDYHQLMKKIQYVINNIDDLDNLKKNGRETYEDNFTMESFSSKLITTIDSMVKNEV